MYKYGELDLVYLYTYGDSVREDRMVELANETIKALKELHNFTSTINVASFPGRVAVFSPPTRPGNEATINDASHDCHMIPLPHTGVC